MPSIKLLERNVCELIAAGEVVERPASVVKELVENSIDSGAHAIEVEIKRGGLGLIRVADDGCGIPREEVPTAFLRHATSKISSAGDLDGITSLGFRGEALAAISSVSRVTMITCPAGGEATRYVIEGGEEAALEEVGAPDGTTVFVRDIFYNTPARMKFLKKDVHEGNAVQSVTEMLALSHPERAFKLIREGRTVFSTPGKGDVFSALYGILPRTVSENMIPFCEQRGAVAVSGYITAPASARQSRSMQSVFVNGRFVRSRSISASAEEGCRGLVTAGGHPAFAVYVTLPPENVDINVHPAKTEVRFKNEREVTSAVYSAVKLALTAYAGDISNKITAWEDKGRKTEAEPVPEPPGKTTPPKAPRADAAAPCPPGDAVYTAGGAFLTLNAGDEAGVRERAVEVSDGVRRRFLDIEPDGPARPSRTMPGASELAAAPQSAARGPAAEPPAKAAAGSADERGRSDGAVQTVQTRIGGVRDGADDGGGRTLRFVGEVFSTYAVFETDDSVVLMDKHAAHERILYDRFVKDGAGFSRQTLLAPVVVPLSEQELTALEDNREAVERVGFVVERFGEHEAAVREIPTYFTGKAVGDAVEQMAERLASLSNEISPDETEWLMHSCACRAAIKAGSRSSEQELCRLAEEILFGDGIKHCPHGRPVVTEITKKEIEKRFGRIQ